jgi:hypothetical protein
MVYRISPRGARGQKISPAQISAIPMTIELIPRAVMRGDRRTTAL